MKCRRLQVSAVSLMLVGCVAVPPSQSGPQDSKDFAPSTSLSPGGLAVRHQQSGCSSGAEQLD